jgi:hypothetical protein
VLRWVFGLVFTDADAERLPLQRHGLPEGLSDAQHDHRDPLVALKPWDHSDFLGQLEIDVGHEPPGDGVQPCQQPPMLPDHLEGARRGGIDRLGLERPVGGRIPNVLVLDLGLDRRQEVSGPAVALRPLLDRARDPRLPGDLGDRKVPRPVVLVLDQRPVDRLFSGIASWGPHQGNDRLHCDPEKVEDYQGR